MKYRAFISYSHAADGRLAPALQSALHRFAKKWHQLRALRVFRDKTSLAVTPALWESISSALAESEFFLLMGSPEAAESHWVRQEVEAWLEKGDRHNRLLIILTGGDMNWDDAANDFDWEVTTALPEETLRGRFQQEPLFVDLRWARSATDLSLRNARFKDEMAGIAATLHGRPKDELVGEDVGEHRKARRLAWSAVTALVLLAIATGVAAFVAARQRDSAQQFLGRVQTATGMQLAAEGDTWGALIWFAEALRWDGDNQLRERMHRLRLGGYLGTLPRLTRVLWHGQPVNSAEFSPDGTRVVTAAGRVYVDEEPPGTARVWDARTGEPVTGELGHEGAVYSAAFSRDGRRVVTASGDQTARVWDAESGEELLSLPHQGLVRRARFSPDGRRILTASSGVRIWDAETGEALAATGASNWSIWHAAFGPAGGRVVALAANPFMDGGGFALLWEPQTDSVERLRMGGHWGYDGAFSPDGTRVVTASMTGEARLWDATTGEAIGEPMRHDRRSRVAQASFSPDGELVLTAGWDGTARLWHAATGAPVTVEAAPAADKVPLILRHGGKVKSATFSPDGRQVATASTEGTVRLWDAAMGRELAPPLPFSHGGYPEGSGGFVGDSSPGAEFQVGFGPGGQRLVTAGWDGTVRIWELTPAARVHEPVRLEEAPPENGGVFPASPLRFVGNLDREPPRVVVLDSRDRATVRVRDPLTGGLVGSTIKVGGPVGEAVLSADGERLATVGRSASTVARVWDVESGAEIGRPLEHDHYLAYAKGTHASLSPDGRWLATISNGHVDDGAGKTTEGGFVRLWDLESGGLVFPQIEHSSWVNDLAFDRWGKQLAIARSADADIAANLYEGGEVQVWDTRTGRAMGAARSHGSTVDRVWFTPDGRYLVTLEGYDDHVVNVWDAGRAERVARIDRLEGKVGAVAFSQDGRHLATGDNRHNARVWELATGEPVTPWLEHPDSVSGFLPRPAGVTSVAFSQDGLQLVTGSNVNGTLRLWEVASGLPLTPLIRLGEPVRQVAFDPTGTRLFVLGSRGLFSVWELAPDERPVDELVRLTQMLGVRRLDETGVLVGLDFSAFLERWTEQAAAGPAPPPPPTDQR